MTMSASAELVDRAASLVRRTRAGDQNAQATIYRIGEEARKGKNKRVAQMAAAIKHYMESHPATDFTLGAEPAVIINTPGSRNGNGNGARTNGRPSTALARAPSAPVAQVNPESKKPPMPRGLLDQLFDPELFALVVVRACGYRNGLAAAAVTLAAGPPLTTPVVRELGYSQFGSDEASSIFFHGVQFPEKATWDEVAPHLDVPLRRILAVGQCVGRARKIQMVRQPRSSIAAYSPVAGWEMGE
jgi:hypothetical protein